MEQQSTAPTAPQPAPVTESPKPKKDPFSIIGKIAIAIIIIVVLVGGGMLLGKSMNKPAQTNEEPVEEEVGQTTDTNETQTKLPVNPEPTNQEFITFKGGLGGDATSFKQYSFQASKDWTQNIETTEVTDKLTLTNGEYSISIYQAPMGGSMCIYPGEEEGNFKQMYEKYKEITGKNGEVYRRSWDENADNVTYTFCQKSDGTFGTFTTFGGVTATSPNPADEKMLTEIDAIISSLEAQ